MRAPSALRIAAALALLAAALWWAGPARVVAAARGADWRWIAASLLLVAIDRALMAYRWLALLKPLLRPPLPSAGSFLRVFFISSYLGTFLPGIGGDAVRTYALNRLDVPVADAFASVFADRLLGIVSTLLMAIAGVFLARELLQDAAIVTGLVIMAGICVTASALVFSETAGTIGLTVARWLRWRRIERLVEGAVTGVRQYAQHHRLLGFILVISLIVQVLRVLQALCLGRALGLDVPASAYFAFVPVILLVILLPISINGIGTGQVAFVALFARAGVSAAEAFTLSVLYLALGAVGNLPGGALYALNPETRGDPQSSG